VADSWAWPDATDAVRVPAREIAADLGVPVAAGLALVGAFAALTGVATTTALDTAVRALVPLHRAAALQANLAALAAGAESVRGTPVGITR
jgi:2-oxoglutarate ferredoxin oxidoreductase subunit gamma